MALEGDMDLLSATGATSFINGIELDGCTLVSQSGGMQAPQRNTEKGIDYGSYVDAENRTATVEVTLHPRKRTSLAGLRTANEPFPVQIGHVNLPNCTLEDLTVDREASIRSHYKATIKVKEVQEVATGSADLVSKVDNSDGQGNGSVKTSGADKPTTVRTSGEEQETSDGGPDGEKLANGSAGGIVDWLTG